MRRTLDRLETGRDAASELSELRSIAYRPTRSGTAQKGGAAAAAAAASGRARGGKTSTSNSPSVIVF